jgi:acyl-CoA thioesterase-2
VRPAAAAGRPAAQFAVFPEVVGPAGAAAIDRPWPKVLPRHACWGAIELRSATANDRPTGSRLALWARVRGRPVERPATLAFLADLLPLALYWSTGERGRSLDNTIRFMATAPTEWVLLDVCPVSVADGFAHGTVNCWSQDGTLLASASQTLRLG